MRSNKHFRKIFSDTHLNAIFLNNFYKQINSNEYKEFLLEPSRLNRNKILLKIVVFSIVLFYPFYIIVLLFTSLINISKTKKKKIESNRVFLFFSSALPRVVIHYGIDYKKSAWLSISTNKISGVSEDNIYSYYNLLNIRDAIYSALNSIIVFYSNLYLYGQNVIFYQLFSYKWFLVNSACQKIPRSAEILFCNHMDKWANLIDNLNNDEKILLQHGTLILHSSTMKRINKSILKSENQRNINSMLKFNKKYDFWSYNLPFKYTSVNTVYAYSEQEYFAICDSIVVNTPRKNIAEYSIKTIPINNGKLTVLIVGFYREYYREEESVLKLLQGLNLNIFLKKHPTDSPKCYESLKNNYEFDLIETDFYPTADIVISYGSTLALEYETTGSMILYYNDFKMNELRSIIENRIYL